MLKNEIKRDIVNNHNYVSREVLMTLLATNKTLRNRNDIDKRKLDDLDQAICLLWQETFDVEIEFFSSF
jgi:hypothetical protein